MPGIAASHILAKVRCSALQICTYQTKPQKFTCVALLICPARQNFWEMCCKNCAPKGRAKFFAVRLALNVSDWELCPTVRLGGDETFSVLYKY